MALFEIHSTEPIGKRASWPFQVLSVSTAAVAQSPLETALLVALTDPNGVSIFAVARSANGLDGWTLDPQPALLPAPQAHPEEFWGITNPRATWIESLSEWAVVYTSLSQNGSLISLARTPDFKTFERLGAVTPPQNNHAVLFPKQLGGRWLMMHTAISNFRGPVYAYKWKR